jgi:hypothetical protein
MNPLRDVYGDLLIVRPPVPATCNKAGANYKSEVAHLLYSPRRAYDEWLSILDAIVACGGDALFEFEAVDDPFLDLEALEVDGDGDIRPAGSRELLGNLDQVMTGRIFAANGPWVVRNGEQLRAAMPHMLEHRRPEADYYRRLLAAIADAGELELEVIDTPFRWEGMADVAVVGDKVVLTYAVPGHYDQDTSPKSRRSSREGVSFAADVVGVPEASRIYAELVYPHFHGDTVHFGARRGDGEPLLVHYRGGLWDGDSARVTTLLGEQNILEVDRHDAVEEYASNSRQVRTGVLVPDGVSSRFCNSLATLGLHPHRVPLFELFGKAGGGPACATLQLPKHLSLPPNAPIRYSACKELVLARRTRIPDTLRVSEDYFEGKNRG